MHHRTLAALTILAAFGLQLFSPSVLLSDTRLIEKLEVNDTGYLLYNASHWIEQGGIRVGAPLYGDNENLPEPERAAVAALPAELVSVDWIQPSALSAAFVKSPYFGDNLANFVLREPAEIHIAHSDAIAEKPAWLATRYTATAGKLTDTLGRAFTLYKRTADAGEKIILGPNGSASAPMYLVLAKPLSSTATRKLETGYSSNVTDIAAAGARGDGRTINTTIIQTAIDDLSARGGGTVLVSGGIYVTGALELRDNITLRIEAGSILRASPNPADFPPKHASVPGFRSHEPHQFIFAQNAKNITITGGGVIDGYAIRQGYPWGGRNNEHERPRLIRMFSCQNIRVENITLIRAANWTQYYETCTDLVFRDLRIRCHTGVHNQDGIDISGCSNVEIDGFHATTGDDAICIKALTLTPAENIRINNLYSPYANCNILKIGTETHGALKNLHATNIEGVTRYSLSIETVDGSILENITYENAILYDCGAPIFARLGARGRTFKGGPNPATPGALRNVTFRNIRNYANTWGAEKRGIGLGASCSGVEGLRIQNLTIEDCDFTFHGGQTDPKVVTRAVPENEKKYPEYITFGVCPAYGLYLRHIDGLTVRNNRIRSANTDVRPPVVLEDVHSSTLTNNILQTFALTAAPEVHTK
ncbi:glycoside hydrolase family 28 protein [Ereboglobus luteus]|nr:glycosyl hydrolase family 28 protein [Ereboglobus luteus]